MDEAALMLESSDETIARIAISVGYQGTARFRKCSVDTTVCLPAATEQAKTPPKFPENGEISDSTARAADLD
jgi:transcriptional regulator GlxA family with amidase domain